MVLNRNIVSGVLILVLLIFFLYYIRNLMLEYEDERFDRVVDIVKEKEEVKEEIKN